MTKMPEPTARLLVAAWREVVITWDVVTDWTAYQVDRIITWLRARRWVMRLRYCYITPVQWVLDRPHLARRLPYRALRMVIGALLLVPARIKDQVDREYGLLKSPTAVERVHRSTNTPEKTLHQLDRWVEIHARGACGEARCGMRQSIVTRWSGPLVDLFWHLEAPAEHQLRRAWWPVRMWLWRHCTAARFMPGLARLVVRHQRSAVHLEHMSLDEAAWLARIETDDPAEVRRRLAGIQAAHRQAHELVSRPAGQRA